MTPEESQGLQIVSKTSQTRLGFRVWYYQMIGEKGTTLLFEHCSVFPSQHRRCGADHVKGEVVSQLPARNCRISEPGLLVSNCHNPGMYYLFQCQFF